MSSQRETDRKSDDLLWIPDNADGSGWALIDWPSVLAGRRYHYRHAEPAAEAQLLRSAWYKVTTRLDTPDLHAPHENDYYVAAGELAEFLTEFAHLAGAEVIWHIEPVDQRPPQSIRALDQRQ